MKGQDWRLVPIAVASWGAAWLGVSGVRPPPGPTLALFAGLALLCVAAWWFRRRWLAASIAVFAVTLAMTGLLAWSRHSSPVASLARDRAVATVLVRVLAEPQPRTMVSVGQVELVWLEARGTRVAARVPAVILASGEAQGSLMGLTPGGHYLLRVRLGEPRADEAAAAVLSLQEVLGEAGAPGVLDAAANAMREGLRTAVAHSPPDQAALVPSLVVGDTSRVTPAMADDFRATGLTHLMAVSGANLTLTLGVVLVSVRALGLRGWSVRGAAVAGVAGFVLVCGQEPSVLRSAVMGLVALAGIGVGSGKRSLRALSLAVMVLVWLDPWLARSAGFALSVTACAGIVLLGPSFVAALTRWAPRWAAEALAVPLAAQLATQPIVTAISGEVSVVGVLTNLLAGPFVGPTTVLGLSAALLCWVPFLAAGPGWVAGWCSQPIVWLASFGASLPSASWRWGADAPGLFVVTCGAAALGTILVVLLRSRSGASIFVLATLLAAWLRPVPIGWPGEWAATFCDVGQGDATVLNAGNRAAVLVDAGPEPGPTLACLTSLGVASLPLVVLTHYHADHVGGAEAVIARFRPQVILVRAGPVPRWLSSAAESAGAEVRTAVPGEELKVGAAIWVTASAWVPAGGVVPEGEGEGSVENDASVVGVASSGALRVLLGGDVEPAGQVSALRSAHVHGVSLEVDVLKLPHHGSSRQEERFFKASAAAVAIASAGEGNSYGHPSAAALRLSAATGMVVYRTDQHGSIAVGQPVNGALKVATER